MQIFKAEQIEDNYLHSKRCLIYRKYSWKGPCEQQDSLGYLQKLDLHSITKVITVLVHVKN